MKTRDFYSSRFGDYLLLVLSSVLFLWSVSCFDILFGPIPNYMVSPSNQYSDGGVVVKRGTGASSGAIAPRQDPVQITLGSNTRWEESECTISWTVVDRGLTTVAQISEGTLLTLDGSEAEAGTDMTTVHVEARPSGCLDSRLHSERMSVRIPVKFVTITS